MKLERDAVWTQWYEDDSNETFLSNTTSFLSTTALDDVSAKSDDDYTPYPERLETYIVPILFALIFIVGVLGNGTLVVIFLRHRSMRNVPNTYILSLALADLLVILTCVPFASMIYTLESWPWGGPVCRLSETAKDVSIGVSVFTLTALSAERYCVIVNPLRKIQKRSLTVVTATFIWLLAVLFALPAAIVSEAIPIHLPMNRTIIVCSPFPEGAYKKTYAKYNVVCKALVYYMVPLLVIAGFYGLMARRLQASTRDVPGAGAGEGHAAPQARTRRHVARMVLAFILIFVMCFLPYHVFMLWFHFNPNSEDEYDEFWHALRIVGFCFSFLNSCVNPIVLYCVSGVFRNHFNRYLCCRPAVSRHCSRRSQHHSTVENNFNYTFRRHTQDASSSSFRASKRNTLTERIVITTFDENNKQPNSYLMRNLDSSRSTIGRGVEGFDLDTTCEKMNVIK